MGDRSETEVEQPAELQRAAAGVAAASNIEIIRNSDGED